MVRRDPDTGQFVAESEAGVSWGELDQFLGWQAVEIPAADLSGGTTTHEVLNGGEQTEAINFSSLLDSDEVFEIYAMFISITFAAHTTASGQGYAWMHGEISRQSDLALNDQPPFWNTDIEDGVYDIAQDNVTEASEVLYDWVAASASQIKDGSSSAAGPDYDRPSVEFIPFRGLADAGPMFDEDDEIYVPMRFFTDKISNFAVEAAVRFRVVGRTHVA